VILYAGEVAGLSMQCHRMKELKYVRGYVAYIPFLALRFLFHLIFRAQIEGRAKLTFYYLFRIRYKSLMIAALVNNAMEEYLASHPEAGGGQDKKRIKSIERTINAKAVESVYQLAFA
jgi:hypothetical protein